MSVIRLTNLLLVALLALTACETTGEKPNSPAAIRIDRDADAALRNLYDSTPTARLLGKNAKGILVFPGIVKAGFIGGAEYGKGALLKNGRTEGYYNIVAGSYGLQAGVQSFDYVMFFMTESALNYLDNSEGFELGVGPSVVFVDMGIAKSLTTTTAQDDVYAFIFGQKGLMAGLSLQGSKITKIIP
jgi:lipid-binding SYLF domain-containing protein